MKDLLQSLQSYSSRYYTANNLLLEPYKRMRNQRQSGGDTRSMSRTTTPRREIEEIPDESGSEYGSERPTAASNNNGEETDRNGDRDGDDVESEVELGPRKRGGQRGKRKLKDMYLALDGSALLTLGMSSLSDIRLSSDRIGVLIQETIISRLQAEGYVPAHSLEAESEEEEVGNTFEVSDDESVIELESEEGQNENDDLYD
jgi:hypothetical protein